MLFTIAVILLVLWLLGLVSGYTLGNFIYVLLVIAIVLFIVGLVSGRRTVSRPETGQAVGHRPTAWLRPGRFLRRNRSIQACLVRLSRGTPVAPRSCGVADAQGP